MAYVVPIKDEVITKKNLDKNSTLTLLIITDKLGNISSGSIVYFQPSDGKKRITLPQNTLSNMFSGKAVALDGTYKMLTLTGTWLSQFEIKDKKLFSTGNVQQKNEGNNSTQKTNARCIDWYIVTTYYWPDGSVTKEERYLTTTCDCGNADDPYATPCDYIEGGEGGGGPVVEESQDGIETTSTESVPSFAGGPDNEGVISTSWHSLVSIYSTTILGIPWVTDVVPQKPFPVPTLVPFWSNTYGDMYCQFSCSSWISDKMRVSNTAFLVGWRWDELRTYLKLDGSSVGSQPFPGKTGMKVVTL